MTPWRVVGQNLEANKIPQKSTYISTCWILTSIFLISFYESIVARNESPASELNFQCTINLIFCVLLVFHLPIILIFTYDHKINTVGISQSQPPSELQFHDVRHNFNTRQLHEQPREAKSSTNPTSKPAIFSVKCADSKYKTKGDVLDNFEQFPDEYSNIGHDLDECFYPAKDSCKREQFFDSYPEADECSANSKKQLPIFTVDVKSVAASKTKFQSDSLDNVKQIFDEYCGKDQDSIKNNYKREQFSYNHPEGDEFSANSEKQLPMFTVNVNGATASKTKFQSDTFAHEKRFPDERSRKEFLDDLSEKAQFSVNPEDQSSILKRNRQSFETGLFFYASIPGECYF